MTEGDPCPHSDLWPPHMQRETEAESPAPSFPAHFLLDFPRGHLAQKYMRMQISDRSARAGAACGPGAERSAEAAAGAQQTYLYFYANYPATDRLPLPQLQVLGRGKHRGGGGRLRRKPGGSGEEPSTSKCCPELSCRKSVCSCAGMDAAFCPRLVRWMVEDHPSGGQGHPRLHEQSEACLGYLKSCLKIN